MHELKNPDPIAYLLQIHCSSMANIYSKIHISFIPNITKNNIIYYISTQSKIINIYNNVKVSALQERFLELTVNLLFEKALSVKDKNRISDYNNNLNLFHKILFTELPINIDQFTVVELADFLANVDITTYCNIINYFAKIKLIKPKNIDGLLKFYYVNKKFNKYSKQNTIDNET